MPVTDVSELFLEPTTEMEREDKWTNKNFPDFFLQHEKNAENFCAKKKKLYYDMYMKNIGHTIIVILF